MKLGRNGKVHPNGLDSKLGRTKKVHPNGLTLRPTTRRLTWSLALLSRRLQSPIAADLQTAERCTALPPVLVWRLAIRPRRRFGKLATEVAGTTWLNAGRVIQAIMPRCARNKHSATFRQALRSLFEIRTTN